MALEDKITDEFYYTIEFRIEKMAKQDMEKVIILISDFPQTQYKELSKQPKTVVDKTYM